MAKATIGVFNGSSEASHSKVVNTIYECKEGLKQECLKLCKNERERDVVNKKKSIAQLEKWLKADGRTRGLLVLTILHLFPCSHMSLFTFNCYRFVV